MGVGETTRGAGQNVSVRLARHGGASNIYDVHGRCDRRIGEILGWNAALAGASREPVGRRSVALEGGKGGKGGEGTHKDRSG